MSPSGRLQRTRVGAKTQQLSAGSRALHRVDHYTSLPGAAAVATVALLCAVVVGAVLGFPSSWVTGFEVATSSVTLMMVLVIQHTQGREQTATQRKLDELLRAIPEAESSLMMLEEASDDEMQSVERDQRSTRTEITEAAQRADVEPGGPDGAPAGAEVRPPRCVPNPDPGH